jgi:hypothetical protein
VSRDINGDSPLEDRDRGASWPPRIPVGQQLYRALRVSKQYPSVCTRALECQGSSAEGARQPTLETTTPLLNCLVNNLRWLRAPGPIVDQSVTGAASRGQKQMIVDGVWRIATRTTSGSGRSVHGPHLRDVMCQTQTLAAPRSRCHSRDWGTRRRRHASEGSGRAPLGMGRSDVARV